MPANISLLLKIQEVPRLKELPIWALGQIGNLNDKKYYNAGGLHKSCEPSQVGVCEVSQKMPEMAKKDT